MLSDIENFNFIPEPCCYSAEPFRKIIYVFSYSTFGAVPFLYEVGLLFFYFNIKRRQKIIIEHLTLRLVGHFGCYFGQIFLMTVNLSIIEIILYPIIYRHINKIMNETAASGILRPEVVQVRLFQILGKTHQGT